LVFELAGLTVYLLIRRRRRLAWMVRSTPEEPKSPCVPPPGEHCQREAVLKPARRHFTELALEAADSRPHRVRGDLAGALTKASRAFHRNGQRDVLNRDLAPIVDDIAAEIASWSGARTGQASLIAESVGGKIESTYRVRRCKAGAWRDSDEWTVETEEPREATIGPVSTLGPVVAAALQDRLRAYVEGGSPPGRRDLAIGVPKLFTALRVRGRRIEIQWAALAAAAVAALAGAVTALLT
jgi:hypothetical protein